MVSLVDVVVAGIVVEVADIFLDQLLCLFAVVGFVHIHAPVCIFGVIGFFSLIHNS